MTVPPPAHGRHSRASRVKQRCRASVSVGCRGTRVVSRMRRCSAAEPFRGREVPCSTSTRSITRRSAPSSPRRRSRKAPFPPRFRSGARSSTMIRRVVQAEQRMPRIAWTRWDRRQLVRAALTTVLTLGLAWLVTAATDEGGVAWGERAGRTLPLAPALRGGRRVGGAGAGARPRGRRARSRRSGARARRSRRRRWRAARSSRSRRPRSSGSRAGVDVGGVLSRRRRTRARGRGRARRSSTTRHGLRVAADGAPRACRGRGRDGARRRPRRTGARPRRRRDGARRAGAAAAPRARAAARARPTALGRRAPRCARRPWPSAAAACSSSRRPPRASVPATLRRAPAAGAARASRSALSCCEDAHDGDGPRRV